MQKGWFESLFDPFPLSPVERPPDQLFAFYRYFIHPVRWLVLIVLMVSLASTVIEMSLYVFLGRIVDWTGSTPRSEFFATHGWQLAGMVFVVLLLRPVIALLQRGFNNLALVPSLTAMVRWQNYRYVLRQSLSFFQNDFAGRIAQKVMQTGPSLRETVGSLIDGIWTLVVYVGGTMWLFVGLDAWLIAPVAVWLVLYIVTIWKLVPPVRQRSAAVAEASSGLSGRIVDSYTNIQSVKLFARAEREDGFVLEGFRTHLDAFLTFARTMAGLMVSLSTMNSALIVSVCGLGVYLWSRGSITVGAIAIATSLVLRLNQMSNMILRQITSLFENVGAVQNGMQTIARPYSLNDAPDATPLAVTRGAIRFEDVIFHYGREFGRHRPSDARREAGREGRAGRPLWRRQVDAGQSAPAFLRHRRRPHPDRRAGYCPCHPGEPARGRRRGHAGHLAAPPLGARQHQIRPAGGDRRRGRRSRPAGACPRFHPVAAGPAGPHGIRRPRRRARREALRRSAPAYRHRPADPQGCPPAGARRGDQRARFRRSRRRSRNSSTASWRGAR